MSEVIQMKCPNCAYENSRVLDSRGTDDNNSIRRRRECINCGKRYTTYEKIETTPILVIKNDNSRQALDVQKIKRGFIKCCEKRPVTMAQIDSAVNEIVKTLQNSLEQEVKSSYIGELVMEQLKRMDEIAYIRFAAVYKQFKDVDTFISFLKNMK